MKMKMSKKFLAGVLSLSMLLSLSQASFAKQEEPKKELSREKKIEILQKEGMPLSILEKSSDIYIDELLKDEGDFVSVREVGFHVDENGKFQKVYDREHKKTDKDNGSDKKSDEGGDVTTSQLDPSTEFGTVTTVQRISEKTGDNYKFTNHGIWNENPTIYLTDVAAMAWSDNFTMYSDSCTYTYYRNGTWYNVNCNRAAYTPEMGVSHNIDLKNGNFGAGEYTEVAKVNLYPNSTGSANVVSDYCHKEIGIGGITAGFSSAPEISFSADFQTTWEHAVPTYAYFEY